MRVTTVCNFAFSTKVRLDTTTRTSAAAQADSIASAIMSKRKAKKMAEGGMVSLEDNSEESGNTLDDLNFEALGKEQYDDSQLGPDPMDSNEHGDNISSDAHDMISKIRSKMKSKRGL